MGIALIVAALWSTNVGAGHALVVDGANVVKLKLGEWDVMHIKRLKDGHILCVALPGIPYVGKIYDNEADAKAGGERVIEWWLKKANLRRM